MLILSSSGFSTTQVRLKIGEIIEGKSQNILILPLTCSIGMETAERERNCAGYI